MSLNLSKLLVWVNPVMVDVSKDRFIAKTRPATLADLVEVLKQEGAVEHQADDMVRLLTRTQPNKRYLVLPLGDTT